MRKHQPAPAIQSSRIYMISKSYWHANVHFLTQWTYLQGFNYIAALLYLVLNDENVAVQLMTHSIQQRPSYYTSDMSGIIVDIKVLRDILRSVNLSLRGDKLWIRQLHGMSYKAISIAVLYPSTLKCSFFKMASYIHAFQAFICILSGRN